MESANLIRMVVFFSLLIGFMLLEAIFPRRKRDIKRTARWPANLSLVFTNSLILKLAFPIGAVGFAAQLQSVNFGLFNLVHLPLGLSVIFSILILDLAIYWQHRLFHRQAWLWKLHQVHHSDPDYDVTTGSRFHPIEILLSMGIKLAVIALLGPPLVAVILFEIILNGLAMFNHANLKLPLAWDNIIRRVIVTPDMHRVHHSVEPRECHSNFGFNLSIWDRLFNSYVAQPKAGHINMQIGLVQFPQPENRNLVALLKQPFKRDSMDV
ncbi:sterol desaturase family protein [Alginatibacterium sediminis]|uniref:Sterol desaturase family protein n=1 Tax=Alginatibacterium sediminis TaxID=2164068 RepID=A0A420E906_9ALTE|nr:sterol desaturase family protein [Alginatibacterium sediminis]RKF15813.1 sterol desaturase family protein [Alginatibacterium sediminis]